MIGQVGNVVEVDACVNWCNTLIVHIFERHFLRS
jgi:hypothetical protein